MLILSLGIAITSRIECGSQTIKLILRLHLKPLPLLIVSL